MTNLVFNIGAGDTTELIDINAGRSGIESMLISNTDGSNDTTVALYLKNASGTDYYIFKNLRIPIGQTLKLDKNEISFDNRLYNLYITSTRTVSVIIN